MVSGIVLPSRQDSLDLEGKKQFWLLTEGGCVPPPTWQIRMSIAEVGSLSLVGNPWVLTRLI